MNKPIETPLQNVEEAPVILVVAHGSTASAMRRTVLEGLAGRPRDVVIDLRSVMSMTNPGLAVLVGTKARLQARRPVVCMGNCRRSQPIGAPRTGRKAVLQEGAVLWMMS